MTNAVEKTRVSQLDATRFALQTGGNPSLMMRVAQAFLSQLPAWRADFSAAAADPAALSLLLHKMKGSCHAISASGAAQAFECAEMALQAQGRLAGSDTLLSLLAEIETELRTLIAQHGAAS